MSEKGPHQPIEFVERPETFTYRNNTRMEALRRTAINGKAIVMKVSTGGGGYRNALWAEGYRLHFSTRGAPAGMMLAWCTLVEDGAE